MGNGSLEIAEDHLRVDKGGLQGRKRGIREEEDRKDAGLKERSLGDADGGVLGRWAREAVEPAVGHYGAPCTEKRS